MLAVGFLETIAQDLTGGRGQIRLILQPLMAILLGMRLGIADAKAGRRPFLLRFFTEKGRLGLLKESVQDAAIPLLIAFLVDAVVQQLTLQHVRPVAAVVVGALLVWLPFAASRGLTNRFWTRRHRTAEHRA